MTNQILKYISVLAHSMAVERGFWSVTDNQQDLNEIMIANMHCELSEALQEDRAGMPMLYVDDVELGRIEDYAKFEGRKPEGVAVELADFVIRLMDYAEGTNQGFGNYERVLKVSTYKADKPLYSLVNDLHQMLCDTKVSLGVINPKLVTHVGQWLAERGVNLWAVVDIKMDYNEKRPYLHGKRY